ncbi:uncharacterized protein LOC129971679 [Argiope bruennichi]|uniref:uncharacterized protein LOC129971679 n=1 Tax=Argiope bruennichi TaxID=94029 RepID=UPI002493D685|nr:uncharacterized protein LOC129971679 [Argiope bruennichi]
MSFEQPFFGTVQMKAAAAAIVPPFHFEFKNFCCVSVCASSFFECVCLKMGETKELFHFYGNQNMQQWLKEVFRKENIPSFDETPEFIEALKKVMNENEVAENDAKAIIKAKENMRDFYNAKIHFFTVEELQLVTDFIQLNSETYGRVQRLASMAEKMKLKEPSPSNFLLAMTEIEDKEFIKAEKEFISSHYMSIFSHKVKNTIKMNEKLRRYLKSLTKIVEMQKSHYSEIMKGMAYFDGKKGNLEEMIKKSQERLHEANYWQIEGIRHSVLVEKAKKLKDMEERLKTLENKCEAYHSLKPSLKATNLAIEEKEKELLKLEEDFQKLLQVFENS